MAASTRQSKVATATSTTDTTFNVFLHPLVIMNISDHFTRSSVTNGATIRVFGAILGTHKGTNAEVSNSFVLLVSEESGKHHLNVEYFASKRQQFKQVFPDLEFLGWYTNCDEPGQVEVQLHQKICPDNESYLLLTLNPTSRGSELPVAIYESLIDIVDGKPRVVFSRVPYSLATEEAERVGVDHIAKETVATGTHTSAVTDHLSVHYGAIRMLHTRIQFVVDYLRAVQSGELPKNHAILREISSLCHQLPILTSSDFNPEHQKVGEVFRKPGRRRVFTHAPGSWQSYIQLAVSAVLSSRFPFQLTNDIVLISYLATVTKGCDAIGEYVQKLNTLYDHHGILRRTRGSLF